MKRFYNIAILALLLCAAASAQMSGRAGREPSLSTVRQLLNTGFGNAPGLGTHVVDRKVQLVKGRFRYGALPSALGQGDQRLAGASVLPNPGYSPSALTQLLDESGGYAQIPVNAIIKQVLIDVLKTPTAHTHAAFSGTKLSLGVNTMVDLYPSTAVASWTGLLAGDPVGTAATMVKVRKSRLPVSTSNLAYSTLKVYMTNGSLTSGEFNVFVEFYLSD